MANFDYNSNGYINKAEAASVTSLGTVFKGNTEITSFDELQYFTRVTKLGTQEFSDNQSTFKGCVNLTSVALPDSVKQINYQVFANCSSLSFVNLENQNLESIWLGAFLNCTSLSGEVDLPNLKYLGVSAFASTGITKVKSLGNITSIVGGWGANEGVFYNCVNLSFVRLPKTLTSIGVQTFCNCSSLRTLVVESETPPTLGGNCLGGTNSGLLIYVPDNSLDTYKTTDGWVSYADKIKPLSGYVE